MNYPRAHLFKGVNSLALCFRKGKGSILWPFGAKSRAQLTAVLHKMDVPFLKSTPSGVSDVDAILSGFAELGELGKITFANREHSEGSPDSEVLLFTAKSFEQDAEAFKTRCGKHRGTVILVVTNAESRATEAKWAKCVRRDANLYTKFGVSTWSEVQDFVGACLKAAKIMHNLRTAEMVF